MGKRFNNHEQSSAATIFGNLQPCVYFKLLVKTKFGRK